MSVPLHRQRSQPVHSPTSRSTGGSANHVSNGPAARPSQRSAVRSLHPAPWNDGGGIVAHFRFMLPSRGTSISSPPKTRRNSAMTDLNKKNSITEETAAIGHRVKGAVKDAAGAVTGNESLE